MQYLTETEMQHIVNETCAALSREPRVTIRLEPLHGETHWEGGINGHFFRIRTAQSQIVGANTKCHRISEGSRTQHRHLGARYEAHSHQTCFEVRVLKRNDLELHADFSVF